MTDAATALAVLVAEAAAAHRIGPVQDRGAVAYMVGQTLIVVVDGGTVEFRLRADVAAAAARTTDASTSQRGPEWVAFCPSTFDRFTTDRVAAWFEFAAREAAA